MNRFHKPLSGALAACMLLAGGLPCNAAADTWKDIEREMGKSRPRSAIALLEPEIENALSERDYARAVKALAFKIKLEGDIEGNRAEEKILRLEKELDGVPEGMRPVLQTMLGHWYWQFFQQNRWRFMNRTQTAEAPGEDILTWDLPRIFSEIDRHYSDALSAVEILRAVPIAEWDGLLQKGTMPDSFRPTLYDFLAHEALAFYSAGEQAATRHEHAFSLQADSPVFAAPDAFMAWNIETGDPGSVTVRALKLMQELMRFHRDDADPSAFIDVDLLRLEFGYNTAEESDLRKSNYLQALQAFVERYPEHRVSARALAAWAGVLQADGSLVDAHRIASRGISDFSKCPGRSRCQNIVQAIESWSSFISVERVWNAPWPEITVRYRNLEHVYFRLYAYDWQKFVNGGSRGFETLTLEQRSEILKGTPVRAWSEELPPTPDFQERAEPLPVPKDLKPGFYFLVSSHNGAFTPKTNAVNYTGIWVSDLALVLRSGTAENVMDGFVLDALTGDPVSDAAVKSWVHSGNYDGEWNPGPEVQTDADGYFRLETSDRKIMVLMAEKAGRVLGSAGAYRAVNPQPERAHQRTFIFTDRALYRPGQAIRFKGLCVESDPKRDHYATLANQSVTMLLRDVNRKELTRAQFRSNDYGSFSGSFTAPAGRLTGQMSIEVLSGPGGSTHFSVEEYRRPKFRVTLDAPDAPATLDAEVIVAGRAEAYTGAPVDGAIVTYRVVRRALFPPWWYWRCWWHPPREDSTQEIAHGTVATDDTGAFSIAFAALPDRSIDPESEPTFRFEIHADVTDASGETRTGVRTVHVGYAALKASMQTADWAEAGKPVNITVLTRSLDNEERSARARVKIYRLREPDRVQRGRPGGYHPYPQHPMQRFAAPGPDPGNPNSWALDELVHEEVVTTGEGGDALLSVQLDAGHYRALLEAEDAFGHKITALLPLRVVDPAAGHCSLKVPQFLGAPDWSAQPGEKFMALWGTGYTSGRAFIEIEHRGKMIKRFWTAADKTQARIEQAVDESMRGGFTLHVTQVRENRAYLTSRRVEVPWRNKELEVTWERMVSRLEPGAKETWTAVVRGPEAEQAVAEMAATLFDASLDAFRRHAWMRRFSVFRREQSRVRSRFENQERRLQHLIGLRNMKYENEDFSYRHFPSTLIHAFLRQDYRWVRRGPVRASAMVPADSEVLLAAPSSVQADRMMAKGQLAFKGEALADTDYFSLGALREEAGGGAADDAVATPQVGPDLNLDTVQARRNLEETAFFFPHLVSAEDGSVRIRFTMPEALTEWRLMGFVHDRSLRSGFIEATAVTSKDIMVQPNPPRFLREGDALEFTVKVVNLSVTRQEGRVRLGFKDARTLADADAQLGLADTEQAFDLPAGASRSFSWRVKVPDGTGFLQYTAVAATSRLSDGEEGYVPVLPRRILVTESLPLPIRGAGTKTFTFEKLADSGGSETLEHEKLVVQMVSNPAWYAVMALPYLMESRLDCTEVIFNRLYANALARHIAGSQPKIRRIFEQWKNTEALDSPLEKNEDLKNVMLEETPWMRHADRESEARRNVGVLFDGNRLDSEVDAALRKLAGHQLQSGAWPWFPGGRPCGHVTLYITTGFGRMRHLGIRGLDMTPAVKAVAHLDNWVLDAYRKIVRDGHLELNNLNSTIALYLYGRSFFLEDRVIGDEAREAVTYFLGQAAKHWTKLPRQSRAHLALALHRFGEDRVTPADIMTSLKEFAVHDEELGMFWRDTEHSWWWYHAPVESQAMMIEAFDEVARDPGAVEACKVWLLKQKQTQNWKTTRATADAVYALLMRGTDLLASDALVAVSLGGETIEPDSVEAGTGFYEERFGRGEITPDMARITLAKSDEGVAWGSMHWQYLEDMSKITAHEATPLVVRKDLYVKQNSAAGPQLVPVGDSVRVGDELVTRIVLRTDRDMEYVHLKDRRGSGTEPVRVLSGYRWQDGLGYYESTRDTASHFYIDYLPKGTYVLEYSVRVQHRGVYRAGIAQVQCLYAPEFNSHSESALLHAE